jgi:hypothetical protein
MEPNDENPIETNHTIVLARLVVLTILGMCAGLLGGILYGGIVLFNWIFN